VMIEENLYHGTTEEQEILVTLSLLCRWLLLG